MANESSHPCEEHVDFVFISYRDREIIEGHAMDFAPLEQVYVLNLIGSEGANLATSAEISKELGS